MAQGEVPAVLGDEGKATKKAANYGPGSAREHCGICRYYLVIPQKTVGGCTKVRGPIKPEDWCKFFAPGGSATHTATIERSPPKAVGAREIDR